ncbi:MAG: hypothetical protein JXN60_08280, partial [Lentisphaerae bacterium]|nr:hypothetical protein [Lentisphaerota bacterium]
MNMFRHKRDWIIAIVVLPLLMLGTYDAGKRLNRWIRGPLSEMLGIEWGQRLDDRRFRVPGPPRVKNHEFVLNATNAVRMTGRNSEQDERWCDVAGNYYSREFVVSFDYEGKSSRNSEVLLRVDPVGKTFSGRIEAHRLKPYFAYQMKLTGVFDDRRAFEIIGRLGRWLLPGRGTNYTDLDYLRYPDKEKVDAYIFFDFFVTDKNGDAVREFRLDSSLHVLYNWQRQRRATVARDTV